MLIIRRRRGESIVIGEEIRVEILETSPTQVKLGITAPKEVTVLRSEIRTIRDVNVSASATQPDPGQLTQFVEQLRDNPTPAAPSPAGTPAEPSSDEPSA